MRIGLIDYGAGNLYSVSNALIFLGHEVKLITDQNEFYGIDKLVFPGVGHAGETMNLLNNSGLGKKIVDEINSGVPLLGICLGMQLLLENSEEGNTACLGIIEGNTKRFSNDVKVPHIGWNQVDASEHYIFNGIPNNSYYYFVHSFFAKTSKSMETTGVTTYGSVSFSSVISKGNVVGVQFHPEKSGEIGLQLLNNFCNY